jgi:hypothetical protein
MIFENHLRRRQIKKLKLENCKKRKERDIKALSLGQENMTFQACFKVQIQAKMRPLELALGIKSTE